MKLTWQELLDLHCLVFDKIQGIIDSGEPELDQLHYWKQIEDKIWLQIEENRKELEVIRKERPVCSN